MYCDKMYFGNCSDTAGSADDFQRATCTELENGRLIFNLLTTVPNTDHLPATLNEVLFENHSNFHSFSAFKIGSFSINVEKIYYPMSLGKIKKSAQLYLSITKAHPMSNHIEQTH